MGYTYHAATLVKFTHNRSEEQPSASGYRFLKLILDSIEALPAVQVFLMMIAAQRRNGRPGYPPSVMLRALALRYLLPERYVAHLIARLRSSPQLRAICGFRGSLPSHSTFSRFFGLVSGRLIALEQAIAEIVDALKKRLPRMGRKVAVDSTDIESYANPRRTRVRDTDAAWGVRTRKNKTKGDRKTDWFFGYKTHSLIDAVYGVPLVHVIRPANEGDTMKLRTLVNMASSAHNWFQPEYLMADKGCDSQTNHRFLYERGTSPIIHIRRPKSEDGRHSDFYDEKGAPVCGKDTAMLFVRTDPETGRHLYRCPPDGCSLRPRNMWSALHCPRSDQWENPEDDLRVIGAVPRRSAKWERLYGERTVIERMFNSVKRSRILNRHQFLSMKKVVAHAALSTLTYLATMLARVEAGEIGNMRRMAIRFG